MPATERAADRLVAKLLERVAQASEFSEACSIVLDGVAEECEFDRAVVALCAGGKVHGVSLGLSDDRLDAFLQDIEPSASELGVTIFTSQSSILLSGTRLDRLGFSSGVALPLPTATPDVLAAVIVEAAEVDARMQLASRLFARVGPALARTLELDLLRQTGAKLERQRDLLSTIVDGLPDPVLLTNWGNEVVLANRRADQLLIAGSEDSEGRRRAVQINNLLFSSFLTQTVIGSHRSGSRELNLVDPADGSDLLFEVLSVPVGESAGEGTVISILRDITDLKRAVTELEAQINRSRLAEHHARRERDQLNVILENVGDPILVTDDQSNIILMNPEADRLFVVPPDATPGQAAKWRLVRANDTVFTTMISDLLIRTEQRRTGKVELVDPETSSRFTAEVVSSKILNARGEPTAIVSVVHDLTQLVENERLAQALQTLNDQLEDRIRHATEELEEHNRRLAWQSSELERASRLKSEFLANMSHELRTPINVVLGYTSLMRERIYGELTGQQEESLGKIYSTSQHLLELINDILDLSKIEAGRMPLHVEDVRLQEVLDELGEAVRPMVRKKHVEFRTELDERVPVVRTDRTKLRQILLNLASNAVKFTHEGSVTVSADRIDGDTVRIVVADTGIGIKPSDLETIFEDFRQVDQSHTREYGGTGLGLSITKKLLRLLGGDITVTSHYGHGSRFEITLPTETRAQQEDQVPAGEPV